MGTDHDRDPEAAMETDPDRIGERIEQLGRIGATASGGVTRLGLTDEEGRAMALVRGWLEELGCDVRHDAAGNLWGRFDPAGRFVVCGGEDPNVERYSLADGARTVDYVSHDQRIAGVGHRA
jgi:acetylornithine deacetylase/succinyl-diaminopimelate desuccinylase-like protein